MTMDVIEDYILAQPEEHQTNLRAVYDTIRSVIPAVEQKISWGMPTFRGKYNIIHFAAQKKHIGIYPGPEAVEHFTERLKKDGYKFSKGAIQIPYSDQLPLDFVREITLWCANESRYEYVGKKEN